MINSIFDLSGKTVLITGASSGLGWRFAQVLSAAGAKVIATARRKERLDKLCYELTSAGGSAISFPIDVADPASIETQLNKIFDISPTIDILVNNAGILRETPVFEDNLNSFNEIFNTNVRGLWLVTQKIAKHMRNKTTQGSIINISSISGDLVPSYNESAYCASKAAVLQMTKQLVGELSPHQIRINAILPGLVHTEMTHKQIENKGQKIGKLIPLGFIANPEDLDGAILYFASNRASRFVTGSCLVIDGGDSWRGV